MKFIQTPTPAIRYWSLLVQHISEVCGFTNHVDLRCKWSNQCLYCVFMVVIIVVIVVIQKYSFCILQIYRFFCWHHSVVEWCIFMTTSAHTSITENKLPNKQTNKQKRSTSHTQQLYNSYKIYKTCYYKHSNNCLQCKLCCAWGELLSSDHQHIAKCCCCFWYMCV